MNSPLPTASTGSLDFTHPCVPPLTLSVPKTRQGVRFRCQWVDYGEQIAALVPAWQHLSDRAIHRNFSFEPNFLIPALQHLNPDGARLVVVFAESPGEANVAPRLCGLMPVVSRRFYRLPISCVEIWKHHQGFDSTPLLDVDDAEGALAAMLDFLKQQGIGLVSWDTVSADGQFADVLTCVLQRTNAKIFLRDSFTRACLRAEDDAAAYISRHVSKNIRRTSGRMRRRLEEQGTVTFDVASDIHECQALTGEFLRLEASGWKGKSGGALACHADTRAFFEALVTASAEANRLRMLTLKLDGRPIAIQIELHSRHRGAAYKTAFDHQYAAFSPGILIELEGIVYQHQLRLDYLDSCTAPDNQTMNRLWGQRLAFQSLVTSLQAGLPGLAISVMPTMQRAAHGLRKWRQSLSRKG